MSGTQEGYLLIADITGYTGYLSKSELDHAQEILTSLLELLVNHTRPPLVISRLAGDAVISYGLRTGFVGGQTFVEMIEDTYLAFRKSIEQMVINNTCRCNACANVSALDLKFFVHYGSFGLQKLGEHKELVGNDVNLIHRLLKNHVTEKTGVRAYTLYTAAAIEQLGLADLSETMTPHVESYEHLGEVKVWVQDMQPVWVGKRQATRVVIPPEQVALKAEIDIAMPPELVWDYLIQPDFRKVLLGSDRQEIHNRQHGRVAPGSVIHCIHGKTVIPETVLEWQPFERIVTQDLMPVPFKGTYVLAEFKLAPTESGTRLTQMISKGRGPFLGRLMTDRVMSKMEEKGMKDIEAFKQSIEKDLAAKRGEAEPAAAMTGEAIRAAAADSLQETA